MAGYLSRLTSALGAYQFANIVGKVFAIVLLPLYTGRIDAAGYGVAETLLTFVILVSIVVRVGIIEAFLRFYYSDEDPERRTALARRAVGFLMVTSTLSCLLLLIPAGEAGKLITGSSMPVAGPYRIAVLGIWAFTNLELAQAILRVDERLRAYATVSVINTLATIAVTVLLVLVAHRGYEALLLGNYGVTTLVLLGLWWTMRDRLMPRRAVPTLETFRTLFRFGIPTVPAEASVYALSVLDRQYIVHEQGQTAAGQYAIAIKVAGAIVFIVTAFQYAWPPLAYSITDDAEASRFYALVTTYYALITGLVVCAISLEARYIIHFLAPHTGYLQGYTAVPWVTLGWALYGLWVVFLVIAGRAQVTRRNFAAAATGAVINIVLLVILVPALGIAGGGIALCGAYVGMLGVMYLLVRRAFPVAFEWRRLAHLVVVLASITSVATVLLPDTGLLWFVVRGLVFVGIGVVLLATGFLHGSELTAARALLRRGLARRAAVGADPPAEGPDLTEAPS
jgi:O-antigen/teichoic acid export membrane protein